MLEVSIPGRRTLYLENVVLDFNGTLALDGTLLPGVPSRLNQLARNLNCYILTADTFGTVRKACENLNCTVSTLQTKNGGEEKRDFVERLGAEKTAAIGNGNNDALMLEKAALGIFIMEAEGFSVKGLLSADAACRNIDEGLEMLLNPRRLIATLRI